MAQIQIAAPQQAQQPLVPGTSPGAVSPVANGSNQFLSTSLYVGDLETNVSETQLYDVFNRVGNVVSIRVCRDIVTKRSLGYAYVNYHSAQEASQALELLNFTHLNGKPIRIMFSHRDPSIRKSGAANIFIKNLDKSIDNKALYDTFSAFGPILSCKVVMDGNGQSKGYGFVQFEQDEAARDAIEKVNGMLLNDKQVYVGPFVRRQERESNGSVSFNNVYVKNLAEVTTDEDLNRIFGAFGVISSAVVMRDDEGKSRGFGFVNFETADDAARAVEALNGTKVDDKEWYVGRAQKKSEREAELRAKFEQDRRERTDKYQGVNLYIKNLDKSIDDSQLHDLFSGFGSVISCKVMKDPQGQSRGSGFVAFSTAEEANHAVTEMNGKNVTGKSIYVALAQKKEEKRTKLQNQFPPFRNVVGVAPTMAANLPMYHPAAPGYVPQLYFPPQAGFAPQHVGFGYQQPMFGMRPGGPLPNLIFPVQRQGQQGPRAGVRRGGGTAPQQQPQQQQQQPPVLPQQAFHRRGLRYAPAARNTLDMPSQGAGSVISSPSEGAASVGESNNRPLTSTLALAPQEQQRVILGEQLYPLVDKMEHDHAGKVTGMLLEMDQTEILHLIESPDALKAKVGEAMEVLRKAKVAASLPTEQLAAISLNGPVSS